MGQQRGESLFDAARLQLSVLRAFAGEVTGNVAGILASFMEMRIVLAVYFFIEPSEEDREHIEVASTEILADYHDMFSLETELHLISEINDFRLPWLFLRAEVKR